MRSTISQLTIQRDDRLAHRDALKTEIASTSSVLSALKSKQSEHSRKIAQQAQRNGPELAFWEENLGLRIEGIGGEANRLRFFIAYVDEKGLERGEEQEAWFEMDVGGREYKLIEWRPKVEKDDVETLLDRLNEGRDFAPFLKGMRGLFLEYYRSGGR
jgi:kinetochore protein Spc25, fungi type